MASKRKKLRPASLVIRNASNMTKQGRKDIAAWLRMHADHLLKHGNNYSGRFTGGYNAA